MNKLFASISNQIIEALNHNIIPWRRPWNDSSPMVIPLNAKSNKPYQGMNVAVLWMAKCSSAYWATEATWHELGASVYVQSPKEIGVFLKTRKKSFFRTYKVYNLDHVVGCDWLRAHRFGKVGSDFGVAETVIRQSKVVIRESTKPVYDVRNDIVYCPDREKFDSEGGYYTTIFHELIHWTGHSSRLGRVFGERGSYEYGVEELVAELGTCFLAAQLEIPETLQEMPNSVSYLKYWVQAIGNDYKEFFRAASLAQKAVKFILKNTTCL